MLRRHDLQYVVRRVDNGVIVVMMRRAALKRSVYVLPFFWLAWLVLFITAVPPLQQMRYILLITMIAWYQLYVLFIANNLDSKQHN